jgi:hypothetical protein
MSLVSLAGRRRHVAKPEQVPCRFGCLSSEPNPRLLP